MKLAELNQQLQNKFSKKYPKYLRDYLEVRKSKIKGAGLGLFTTIDIEKGEYIDVYMGRKLNASQVLKEDPAIDLYLMEINKNHFIDGGGKYKCPVSFVNDARGLTRTPGIRNNCYFDLLRREKKMALIASRNIKAGEELFVYYGDSYWRTIKRYIREGIL